MIPETLETKIFDLANNIAFEIHERDYDMSCAVERRDLNRFLGESITGSEVYYNDDEPQKVYELVMSQSMDKLEMLKESE